MHRLTSGGALRHSEGWGIPSRTRYFSRARLLQRVTSPEVDHSTVPRSHESFGPFVAVFRPLVAIVLQFEREHAASSIDVDPVSVGEQAAALRAAKTLRARGFSVELPPAEQKFGKALERAAKLNSRYALILGDNEVAEGSWTLKTLADGSQQKLTEAELLDFLRRARD